MANKSKAGKPKTAGITPLPGVFDRASDPESVRCKHWTFEESEQGTTDLNNRIMTLPMGEDDQSYGVRTHEMLHAALSPLPTGEMDEYFLAAEDGRIESIATAKGIERPAGIPEDAGLLARMLGAGDIAGATTTAIAVVGAPNETAERKALAKLATAGSREALELSELMDWAAGVYAADPSVKSAYKVAGRLREILGVPQPPPPSGGSGESKSDGKSDGKSEPGDSPGKGDESGDSGDSGDGGSDESDSASAPESSALSKAASASTASPGSTYGGKPGSPVKPGVHGVSVPKPPKPAETADPFGEVRERKVDKTAQPGRPKEVFPVDMGALAEYMPVYNGPLAMDRAAREALKATQEWARASVQYPARPIVLVQREHGHKRSRATDYGTVPVRMHRMTIDSKVFASKKHKRQGTVLIDQSGSMYIDADEIRELIEYAPAAVIAGYWGNYDGTGTIRVLAAGGHMVAERDLQPDNEGNEIDGPAIAWLAAQRGPRIWVCDGIITTTGDGRPTGEMRQQFERMILKARIITAGSRVMNAKKYLR